MMMMGTSAPGQDGVTMVTMVTAVILTLGSLTSPGHHPDTCMYADMRHLLTINKDFS